jgi:hypothetical protein
MGMTMPLQYNPGQFSALASTQTGRRLWEFLSSDAVVRDMELASDLGHAAVAAIEEPLLERFGEVILEDRYKQMIGHMVRQVLEKKGYVIEQSNVTIASIPFSKGTRYKRPEWYRVYVFRNSADEKDICFSAVRTGAKLPRIGNNKWRYSSSFATKLRAAIGFRIRDLNALGRELEEKGFKRVRLDRTLRAG